MDYPEMDQSITKLKEQVKGLCQMFNEVIKTFEQMQLDLKNAGLNLPEITPNVPNEKSLSVKEAAEIMGKAQQFVRLGLQRGELPFGNAVKLSTKWTYYISPARFYEYVGVESEVS